MEEIYCLTEREYPCFSDGCFFQLTRGRPLMKTRHYHSFYELLCVVSGSCVQEVNGVPHTCGPGSVVFLRQRDVHCFTEQNAGTSVAALSVQPDEMRNFLTAYRLDPDGEQDAPFFVLTPSQLAETERLCGEGEHPVWRALLGLWLGALTAVRSACPDPVPASFAAVCAEMHRLENAAEGVPAFLRLSNFSHSQLCRLSKRWLHRTPLDYVNGIRLEYAYDLIAFGELDYVTICEQVGFSSFSHFSALVKKTYGMSPAAIRKKARGAPRTV